MAVLQFTVLGCGSSGGVPRLGGKWGACDPQEPRNRRLRCSLLVQRFDEAGETAVLIDASPDLRAQLLGAGVGRLDAVVFTHPHADHTHGIDDLRMIVFNTKRRLPVYADRATAQDLTRRFRYVFETPEGSNYPPILELHRLNAADVIIDGAGGAITLKPFQVAHGSIHALGFRIEDVAYLPDVSDMTPQAWEAVSALDCWIVDALRRTPHPSHTHLEKTLGWIARAAPRRAILTNLHVDMDYASVLLDTPEHVAPAYDGLTLRYES